MRERQEEIAVNPSAVTQRVSRGERGSEGKVCSAATAPAWGAPVWKEVHVQVCGKGHVAHSI